MQPADAVHRPWPLPDRSWVMAMQRHDLLFMHWPVQPAVLRPFIPPALELETFDGAAWLGIAPFRMQGARPRLIPPLPRLSAFPELNVRTYVTAQGKPGIWFFSLDAANPLTVVGAHSFFHLPDYNATMAAESCDGSVRYTSMRTHASAFPATFIGRYRPTGPVYHRRWDHSIIG